MRIRPINQVHVANFEEKVEAEVDFFSMIDANPMASLKMVRHHRKRIGELDSYTIPHAIVEIMQSFGIHNVYGVLAQQGGNATLLDSIRTEFGKIPTGFIVCAYATPGDMQAQHANMVLIDVKGQTIYVVDPMGDIAGAQTQTVTAVRNQLTLSAGSPFKGFEVVTPGKDAKTQQRLVSSATGQLGFVSDKDSKDCGIYNIATACGAILHLSHQRKVLKPNVKPLELIDIRQGTGIKPLTDIQRDRLLGVILYAMNRHHEQYATLYAPNLTLNKPAPQPEKKQEVKQELQQPKAKEAPKMQCALEVYQHPYDKTKMLVYPNASMPVHPGSIVAAEKINVVYINDVSGSMNEPFPNDRSKTRIDVMKESITLPMMTSQLRKFPGSTFSVICFDGTPTVLFQGEKVLSEDNKRKYRAFNSGGGTDIFKAIQKALDITPKSRDIRTVFFLLTDGEDGSARTDLAPFESISGNAQRQSELSKHYAKQLGIPYPNIYTAGMSIASSASYLETLSAGSGVSVKFYYSGLNASNSNNADKLIDSIGQARTSEEVVISTSIEGSSREDWNDALGNIGLTPEPQGHIHELSIAYANQKFTLKYNNKVVQEGIIPAELKPLDDHVFKIFAAIMLDQFIQEDTSGKLKGRRFERKLNILNKIFSKLRKMPETGTLQNAFRMCFEKIEVNVENHDNIIGHGVTAQDDDDSRCMSSAMSNVVPTSTTQHSSSSNGPATSSSNYSAHSMAAMGRNNNNRLLRTNRIMITHKMDFGKKLDKVVISVDADPALREGVILNTNQELPLPDGFKNLLGIPVPEILTRLADTIAKFNTKLDIEKSVKEVVKAYQISHPNNIDELEDGTKITSVPLVLFKEKGAMLCRHLNLLIAHWAGLIKQNGHLAKAKINLHRRSGSNTSAHAFATVYIDPSEIYLVDATEPGCKVFNLANKAQLKEIYENYIKRGLGGVLDGLLLRYNKDIYDYCVTRSRGNGVELDKLLRQYTIETPDTALDDFDAPLPEALMKVATKLIDANDQLEQDFVNKNLICPITQELIRDPVFITNRFGIFYERAALTAWFVKAKKRTIPLTNEVLKANEGIETASPSVKHEIVHTLKTYGHQWLPENDAGNNMDDSEDPVILSQRMEQKACQRKIEIYLLQLAASPDSVLEQPEFINLPQDEQLRLNDVIQSSAVLINQVMAEFNKMAEESQLEVDPEHRYYLAQVVMHYAQASSLLPLTGVAPGSLLTGHLIKTIELYDKHLATYQMPLLRKLIANMHGIYSYYGGKEKAIDAALVIDPSNAAALANKASNAVRDNKLDQAKLIFTQIKVDDLTYLPIAKAYYYAARSYCLRKSNEWAEAEQACTAALDANAEQKVGSSSQVEAALGHKTIPLNKANLMKQGIPLPLYMYTSRAEARIEQGKVELAGQDITAAFGKDPQEILKKFNNLAVCIYKRAIYYQTHNEFQLALNDYSTAILGIPVENDNQIMQTYKINSVFNRYHLLLEKFPSAENIQDCLKELLEMITLFDQRKVQIPDAIFSHIKTVIELYKQGFNSARTVEDQNNMLSWAMRFAENLARMQPENADASRYLMMLLWQRGASADEISKKVKIKKISPTLDEEAEYVESKEDPTRTQNDVILMNRIGFHYFEKSDTTSEEDAESEDIIIAKQYFEAAEKHAVTESIEQVLAMIGQGMMQLKQNRFAYEQMKRDANGDNKYLMSMAGELVGSTKAAMQYLTKAIEISEKYMAQDYQYEQLYVLANDRRGAAHSFRASFEPNPGNLKVLAVRTKADLGNAASHKGVLSRNTMVPKRLYDPALLTSGITSLGLMSAPRTAVATQQPITLGAEQTLIQRPI
ncbi:MAG: VWA domain-containing protein [Gammaproteobacteria bacterium]